ncbi:lasso peptide biosynthesis B2 protein [Streptomyces sp. MS19]|uniref:lasso peptide biosynthesis B2 protein n=1 Tax=Streptomyces sp. MS19 TaxID=3385972 RepID=UPI0039A0CEC8
MSHPVALPPRIGLTPRQRLRAWGAAVVATRCARHPERVVRAVMAGARPATSGQAAHAVAAVVTVRLALGGTSACLPRSLAALLYCRAAYGAVPVLVVGVRPGTAMVHAWVEGEGQPAGEPADPRRMYVPIRFHHPWEHM